MATPPRAKCHGVSLARQPVTHGQDCCSWKGVQCDEIIGHVVGLDLGVNFYVREYNPGVPLVANEVHSCLLQLKYLNHLDLSRNSFHGSPIPKFFGSMARLRYLNLSYAEFSGIVPHHLGNLSSLRVLDINNCKVTLDDFTWVYRLSSLQYLNLSYMNINRTQSLLKVLNMIPSLLELHLPGCGLDNIHLSHMHVNSTISNVQYLDLSDNSFEGELPSPLRNMTSLRFLDLQGNQFNSSIPLYLEKHKSLEHLNLGYNAFHDVSGMLSLMSNQCSLRSFDMSGNRFDKKMFISYGILSSCTMYNFETLCSSDNGFIGHLPDWLGQLKHLKYLDLSGNLFNGSNPNWLGRMSPLHNIVLCANQFIGVIPLSLGNLSALRVLDLSYNKLNGTIPVSIGQLSNLKILDLSSNSLEGITHFANLSMLDELRTSYAFLTLKVRSDWIPPFQLKSIVMGSCRVGIQFPQWLQTQKKVIELDLSNTSISGTFPKWLLDMPLRTLDLSHNHISGPILKLPSTLEFVWLSHNYISGPLPQNIGDMVPTLLTLSLADNLINGLIPNSLCKICTLKELDLSKNMLFGNLPQCWGDSGEIPHLWVMKFSSNKLSGIIPSSIGHLSRLGWLHLNNNSLYGELSMGLRNCTSLLVLDLGENGFSGNIPGWIGELESLRILRLHKNMFNGKIPLQLCQLLSLQIIDLANNNLEKTIPRCYGNLSGMVLYEHSRLEYGQWFSENMMQDMKGNELEYSTTLLYLVNMDLSRNNLTGTIPEELSLLSGLLGLNLSHNNLTGSIPKKIGGLKLLESLDFSNNQLSGTIPESMSNLSFISHLNLSYNNLSGRIPTGKQLQTLDDPSIYVGNSELCGAFVPKKCFDDEHSQPAKPSTSHEETYEGDVSEKVWFYLVIMSGYATGLWGVIGVLLFKNWRHAYF
ncbi:receptor-like protein EIX2 [Camellia sinensis]|uniref:receptor-like protein EIX2 n=1 Tax=Camellia sinensis TaxID=4442 RepID=UPI001036AFDF|nr:receptor-like protein EIX2 [Camellia sinensis]